MRSSLMSQLGPQRTHDVLLVHEIIRGALACIQSLGVACNITGTITVSVISANINSMRSLTLSTPHGAFEAIVSKP